MAKDKDPILDEKFFKLLYSMIHPNVSEEIRKHALEEDMKNHRLYGAGKLLEAAISKKKGLERHDTEGKDFIDGSDAKTSSARWSSSNTKYSANIGDVFNKIGLLRCVVYERQLDKFYFFLIPRSAYAHIPKSSNIEINFNLDGTPKKIPGNNTIINWWDFEVSDFDGILQDIELPYINYKTVRKQKEEEKELKRSARAAEQLLKKAEREERLAHRKSRKSLLSLDLSVSTRNLPTPRTSNPCKEDSDPQRSLDFEDIQPTSLSD
jgi:hypothetical protein